MRAAIRTKPPKPFNSIKKLGGEVIWIQTDVSNAAQVRQMVHQTVARFGRIDYAFNNGGSGGNGRPGPRTWTSGDWDKTIDGYLKSVWLCMKYEILAMLKRGAGVIVNNSSVDGVRAYPFPVGSAYSAAKHGVIGLTKSAALEYVSHGVRINAVCPGWVRTPPVERWMKRDPEGCAADHQPRNQLDVWGRLRKLPRWSSGCVPSEPLSSSARRSRSMAATWHRHAVSRIVSLTRSGAEHRKRSLRLPRNGVSQAAFFHITPQPLAPQTDASINSISELNLAFLLDDYLSLSTV